MATLGRRRWASVPATRKHAFRNKCQQAGLGCHICGNPIDYTLDPTEQQGFSIEHVQPRHLFPELVAQESNWRPAHRLCNEVQGRVFNERRQLRYRPFERLSEESNV